MRKANVRYVLSNSQKKEMFVRSTQLQVAIPIPSQLLHHPDFDPLTFARVSLDDIEPEWVVAAEEVDLPVSPTSGAVLIGTILQEPVSPHRWHIVVPAVIAKISRDKKPKFFEQIPRWPKGVISDGELYLPPATKIQEE